MIFFFGAGVLKQVVVEFTGVAGVQGIEGLDLLSFLGVVWIQAA